MDFAWPTDVDALYAETLVFSTQVLNAAALAEQAEGVFPRGAWRAAGDHGLLGLCIPQIYGGLGLGALHSARLIEAFGKGCQDAGLVFSAAAHLFAALTPINDEGSEALKARLLPKLCSGEHIAANAITEAEAGSDVFALKTTATRDGDHYVLNGTKSYVTNGPVADVFVTYATTNPKHRHMGIVAFAVERDTPGLVVGKPFKKMGLTSSPISAVYFEDCRVPVSNRLGPEGKGARVFTESMLWERSCLFASYLGSMERQLEQVIEQAKNRRQFRRPIGSNQGVSHKIADMKLRLESARLLLYRACWLRDQGQSSPLDIALAKLAVSEAAVQSALDAIQIFGGMGYMVEAGIEVTLRDAIPSRIFSGTSEIQRDIIANGLGL